MSGVGKDEKHKFEKDMRLIASDINILCKWGYKYSS
jgi:hypothetical protein